MKKDSSFTEEQKDCIIELHKKGEEIATLRNKPLILMFYGKENDCGIERDDLYELENKLDAKMPENTLGVDVCIQTLGGDANTSYLLAQLLRDYCTSMETLIPNYAYSGGTLIALASDKILLGRTASISPIDLQLYNANNKLPPFALVDIEKYIDFVLDTCRKIDFDEEVNKTNFLIPLIEKLALEHGTKRLGELFRMRKLTELHGKILLTDYMFRNHEDRRGTINHVIKALTSESPAHDFEIDYNIAKKVVRLNIEKMDNNIYKLTRQLISTCDKAKELGLICSFSNSQDRKPYFEVFLPESQKEKIK